MSELIDLLGWSGAVIFVVAYALVSTRRWEGDSVSYQSLNVIGALLLMVNTFYYRAYPSTVLNLVWGSIALATLLRARRPRPTPSPQSPHTADASGPRPPAT